MNKLLNNLLGMYKQAKLNKKAESYKSKVAEILDDINEPEPIMDYISESEAEKICKEINIPHENEWYKGDLFGYIDEVPDGMVNVLIEHISEDDAEALWRRIANDMGIEAKKQNKMPKKAEEKESAKKDYTEQYAKVKEIMKEYGYGLSDGGYIYLISKEEPKDEGFQVKFKGDRLRVELDGKLKYSGYGPEAIEDFLKGMFYAKKLSSKNTKLTKKASAFKVVKMTNNDFVDLSDSIKDVGDELWGILYGKIVNVIAVIIGENKVLYEPLINDEETQKIYDEAQTGSIETVELLPGDDTYADIGFVAKESSKNKKLTKKAKIVLEQINNEYFLNGKKGDYSDFNNDGKYKQISYNIFVDKDGKTHKVWEFEGTLDKKADKKRWLDLYALNTTDKEEYEKQLKSLSKEDLIDYVAFIKINRYPIDSLDSIPQDIKDEANKEIEPIIDQRAEQIVKKYFNGEIDYSTLHSELYHLFDKSEKKSWLWFKENADRIKKSANKTKAVRKQAKNKEIVVTYEGTNGKEYIVKAPNGLYFNEYVDTDTQHSRGAGPFETLEKAKEMFKKHRPSAKEVVATKKQAVLQESENGLGYVLPNGSVVYPGDEAYLKSEYKANKQMLEKDKKELERLEGIIKKYPDINFDKNKDSVKFQIPRVKKGIEYLELFNETIEDILNAFKNKKIGKQATIKHENGVYNVYSESGKCLGKGYKTKEEAEKRLKQVEFFKHKSSLKQVVISKMAKNLKDIPDSVKKNILSDLVYVILTGKGSFAYKTVAKKLEAIIKELGYGDKLKANEDGSLPTMEIVELISKEPKAMELAGKFANITRAF